MQNNDQEKDDSYPQVSDVWKITKFYNNMSFFGSFDISSLESKENIQPTKTMTMSEKVDHVTHELRNLLKHENKNEIENSINF